MALCVTRFDGRAETIRTANARIVEMEMTRRQRFLSAIAHPQVATLLLMLGTLGLTVELWNPGAILPGVVGGICLLLAFFAFQVVPVSTAGLLLIVFGIALLIVEIKVPSFGILGMGGILSLAVGSLMLPGDVPGVTPGRHWLSRWHWPWPRSCSCWADWRCARIDSRPLQVCRP